MIRYINNNNVFFLDNKDKYEIINELVIKASELGKIGDTGLFKKALEERESLISTGIGFGIAFPHAKISGIKEFFIVAGILKEPAEWDSLDQKPVKAVFLIGGPENQQKEYLKILSKLMVVIKNTVKRDSIINAVNISDVIDQFI